MSFTAGQKLRATQMPFFVCTSGTRPTGHTGQPVYETDTGRIAVYTGSVWVYEPIAAAFSSPGDSGSTTSTSYTGTRTGTANIAGAAFKGPLSGAVRIDWACGMSNNGTGITLVSPRVLTGSTVGSGSSVLAAADTNALQYASSPNELKVSDFYILTGLTPGSDYNVSLMYRVSGNTGTFNRPKVSVAGV
jgi:hypothetical protein